MKSKVINYPDFRIIPIPIDLLQIEIPSWDAVAQPLLHQAMKQYEEMSHEYVSSLTDEMVQSINLPGIETVHQLKTYAMDFFTRTQIEYRFFKEILPFILKYYQENTNTLINSDERDYYIESYIDKVESYAQDFGLDLDEYVSQELKLTGDPIEALARQGLEDFIFKLIAQDSFEKSGLSLELEDYESFIQDNVIHHQVDEIEMRERLSYEQYKALIPEKILSDKMFQYFQSEIEFIINPNVQL